MIYIGIRTKWMTNILQTMFSNNLFLFRIQFHWSSFLCIQLINSPFGVKPLPNDKSIQCSLEALSTELLPNAEILKQLHHVHFTTYLNAVDIGDSFYLIGCGCLLTIHVLNRHEVMKSFYPWHQNTPHSTCTLFALHVLLWWLDIARFYPRRSVLRHWHTSAL